MIQWCDTPRPSANRPSHTAWTESACCAKAIGCRGCTGTTAVPTSILEVSAPMIVAAVSASNSSGICGIQIDETPASSAQRASRRSRSTLLGVSAPFRTDHHADAHLSCPLHW